MKILLINKFFYIKGGAERYMFNLAEGLKASGHNVIFFSMQDKRNLQSNQSQYFVSPVGMHGSLKSKFNMIFHIAYSKEAYKKMTLLLKKENPDLVILNNIHKHLTCAVIDAVKKFRKDLPIYWVCHDLATICPSYTMINGSGDICEKCLDGNFNHCKRNKCVHGSYLMSALSCYEAKQIHKHHWYDFIDKFICPSNFYRDMLVKAHFTNSPIIWLRNPLSINTKFEINDHDDGYILYFGRLSKEKGVINLINSMRDLEYKLRIVGTGPIENDLKIYVKKYKLDYVVFKGFKEGDELKNIIRNSRCVVLPSEWYENCPYSAIEAMSFGKPLIVNDIGGLPELLIEKQTGFLVKNFSELRSSIISMINLNKNEYFQMCKTSCEFASQSFDMNKYVDLLLEKNND